MAPSRSPFAIFDDPAGEDFSLGVEEEFFLVDAETRALRGDADVVLAGARAPEGGDLGVELKRSQLETGSAVCRDLDELRASIIELRRALGESATAEGARIVALATHPFATWSDDPGVTPDAAYLELDATYGMLTSEQSVCGSHVHVGVRDPDVAIEVMNRCRAWIPTLVALTANSPYWMGHDSKYASYRTQVFHRWPTAGIPEHLDGRAGYDRVLEELTATESIDGPARLYWDIRPSARYPTLEFRSDDVLTTVDESVATAAVIRALVQTAHADALAEVPYDPPSPELLRSALWRASRFGLSEQLVDVGALRLRPGPEVLGSLLEHVRPVLEERGEWAEVVATAGFVLREGTGAERQRRSREGEGTEGLRAVVDRAVTATTARTA
ncbi:glutamate--cysteine ligase [Aquihabitans daechungensis]|uniref:carboxylate-amine ligase n=1 Tax=Aquihabitans daechungensis TaxID=1052257 RepID=UPI003B9E602B